VQPLQVVKNTVQWETLAESSLISDYGRLDLEPATLLNPPPQDVFERIFHNADYRRRPLPQNVMASFVIAWVL
jgi:hypothetical protein